MSPARESLQQSDQTEKRLARELRSADESYRSTVELYLAVRNGSYEGPGDPQTAQAVYDAAREVRIARKRRRRAAKVLASFTTLL